MNGKDQNMKTNKTNTQREESTYALIERSREQKRAFAELVVYGVILLSAIAAIWEFGQELNVFRS
jgi:hypothetical protein